jgi:hypothetical protein
LPAVASCESLHWVERRMVVVWMREALGVVGAANAGTFGAQRATLQRRSGKRPYFFIDINGDSTNYGANCLY